MEDKQPKNHRTLSIYTRLCEGKVINKSDEAIRFGVDERSIQRDIDDIRAFLDELSAMDAQEQREVVYDRIKKGFVMVGGKPSLMTNSEIFAISKILLESRAFTKKEIFEILDKLVAGCVPEKNMKMVFDLLANEKYHYVELRHKRKLKDILWDIGEDIKNHRRIEITYEKIAAKKERKLYIVEPVGIMFSEYYFYLNAYINEQNASGQYVHRYQYPAIFRLDRISGRRETGTTYKEIYNNRFEEGEFRKRIQFMYTGELVRLRFRFYGLNIDAILDRLPTARIVEEKPDYRLIEADVYGTGVIMWLLSQGDKVEVVRPKSLRDEMKKMLTSILELYND